MVLVKKAYFCARTNHKIYFTAWFFFRKVYVYDLIFRMGHRGCGLLVGSEWFTCIHAGFQRYQENRQQLSVNTSLTLSYPGKFSVKMISFLT